MANVIFLADNPLDVESWTRHEFEGNVIDFLMDKYPQWPATARLYHKHVSHENDVTPSDENGVNRLAGMTGEFYMVIYPGDPLTIIAIVVAVVVVAVTYLLTPKIPSFGGARNQQDSSPNNSLGQRTNEARINERIPDIFGQVRSVPDLLMLPYRVYRNHQEVEISYMCLGKGSYSVEDIRDGETGVEEIAGTTVEVYAPFTSPNSGDDPEIRIGTAISEDIARISDTASVNGQTLRAPNANSVTGKSNIRFEYPDTIHVQSSAGIDFTDFFDASDVLTITNATYTGPVAAFTKTSISCRFTYSGTIVFPSYNPSLDFQAGDTLTIANASRTDGTHPVDLAGSYTVSSVNATTITLSSPAGVNSDWNILNLWSGQQTTNAASDIGVSAGTRSGNVNGEYTVLSVSSNNISLSSPASENADWEKIDQLSGAVTPYGSPILSTTGPKWIGPFFINVADMEKVYSNFVATQGLFKDDGSQQVRFDVEVQLELTPTDANGTPIGAAETFNITLEGSATNRDPRAVTLYANPTFTGYCNMRAIRLTDADLEYAGTVVDEVKWQKVYVVSPIEETHFGNVTTVYAQTYATTGALSVKERKLNMLATRKLPLRISGDTFDTDLTATKSADEILSFMCLDPYIGNRQKAEIDFNSIYETVAAIKEYFNDDAAAEFSYTFDTNNMSFEESVNALADAIFSTAYRQGNRIKLHFEAATENSSMLFNHRNKLPGSETRTITFGNKNDYDGVEVDYVDPETDFTETYYIPTDRSAVNPIHVKTAGVRTYQQAFWRAWRTWNQVQYQNIATVFDATQEAAALILKERILVADNTRPDTQDGEILAQFGLLLTLSQDITFEDDTDYVIFLQHYNATVESIAITPGPEVNQVLLATAPSYPLALDPALYARTTYIITDVGNTKPLPFLITEKEPLDRFSYHVTAVNYTPIYYQQDRLEFWLALFSTAYTDYAPYKYGVAAQGAATIVTDTVRGYCHSGASSSDFLLTDAISPASYTKTAWLKKTNLTTIGHIMSAATDNSEQFLIKSNGELACLHNGTQYVAAPWPAANAWHHAAVTYDADEAVMQLYIDGELVAAYSGVATRTPDAQTIFGNDGTGGFIGRGSDVRLYNKALSDQEIKELYRVSIML